MSTMLGKRSSRPHDNHESPERLKDSDCVSSPHNFDTQQPNIVYKLNILQKEDSNRRRNKKKVYKGKLICCHLIEVIKSIIAQI